MSEFKWGTKKSRKAVIDQTNYWCDNNEISVTLLGTTDDQADFTPAVVGVTLTPRPAVIYDINRLIRCFMKANKWTEEEAWDWFSFNTERGIEYLKPEDNPPILITEIEDVC